jgi:signal peptidase I
MDPEPIYSPEVPYKTDGSLPTNPKTPVNKAGESLVDFIQTLVLFGAIFAIIYLFIAQPHKVSGNSMLPTYKDGNYILTDKISYHFNQPKRGEVIVLKNPKNEEQDFIKRIIGLPGDSVRVSGGKVYVNDQLLDEKYLPIGRPTPPNNFLKEGETRVVKTNEYIVMGDNRQFSSDSREWGTITTEEIVGKVIFRYWPLNELGLTNNL